MKFVVIRSNLKEAINIIERASGDIPHLPILKNVLIKAEGGNIVLVATNLEIAVTANVAGKIIEDGMVTVPLSLFSSLVANLQSDRLNIESKGSLIEVTTDNYSATMQGTPADDFPVKPKIKEMNVWMEIKGVILREAIQQVMVAAVASDLRPELNTIFFDFSLESLKLVATDGFRLAEKKIPGNIIEVKDVEPFRILIPLKTAQEISRIITNEDIVRIFCDETQVLFKTQKLELISRLIEGNFPDYSQLIPQKFISEVVIERDELINAMKLMSVFSQKNSEVMITIRDDKKTVAIHSADQSIGENNYILPAKIKGESMEVILNWKYLNDALKAIVQKEIFFGFQEDVNPAIIKPTGDISYFYVLKPLMKG
jgi:DNA polymerase-3 subunit beta